jgi:predicted solute-binding protein
MTDEEINQITRHFNMSKMDQVHEAIRKCVSAACKERDEIIADQKDRIRLLKEEVGLAMGGYIRR